MKVGRSIEPAYPIQSHPCFIIDHKGIISSFNNTAEIITGYQTHEIQNLQFIDLFTEPASANDLLKKLQKEEVVKDFPLTFKGNKKTNKTAVLVDAITLQHGSNNNIIITAKLHAEQPGTDKENALLAAIVNSTDDAIISKSLNGIINSWNKAATQILGYQASEMIGRHISLLIPEHLQHEEAEIIHTISKGESIKDLETERIRKDGKTIHVSLTISPILDSSDRVIGASKILKDISKQKQEIDQKIAQNVREIADYKLALDEANIIAITDQKGIIKHANDNFCAISKYSREELIGQDHRIINSGFHSKEFIRNLWVTIANGNIWKGEIKNKAKDGTIYWVDTTIVPFLNEEGKPYQYLAIRSDITSRKEVEENLERSLKEISDYKYAIDESSIVAITDQKGIIKYANDNFCKISKYNREELIGEDHRIINSGFHSKEFIRNLWVTIANGKIWKGELKNKAKDGTIYWVDTTIVPFLNEEGKPYQYLAIRSDITSRKEVEENLENSLKEVSDYKYALDESSIVAITDQKGIIKHANHNFCKISKYSLEELIGQDHRIINSGYHPKAFIRNLWQTIANGKIWRGELKNKAKDGTIYWVDTTIVPFLNNEGKPYQYVAIRADITQRKQAEQEVLVLNEELEKRVKERTEEMESFSYSVSHDLRAPLRAVNGYAKIIEEDYNELFDDEGKRLLHEVQQNAHKMGVLIDDLLAFSRLGRKEVEKNVIDMTKLAESAIGEINQTTTHQATIKLQPLLPVKADTALMKNVMINLISNAIKYSGKKEKPLIEIKSKQDNSGITYSIKDNGVGFDMQYVHKLFGVFQRLHSNDEFAGTGVGLAMVSRIINKHRGKIWAEGKVNKGATFYFTLPDK